MLNIQEKNKTGLLNEQVICFLFRKINIFIAEIAYINNCEN